MKVAQALNPQRLHRARLAGGMTQADLAFELRRRTSAKTRERNVVRWETGTNSPHSGVVPAIADALGVSIDYLYGEDEDDEDDPLRRIASELLRRGHGDLATDLLTQIHRRDQVES